MKQPKRQHTPSDEHLVERYRGGDRDAFAQIVHRYQQELFHFLVRFLGSRAQAEDAFQETFMQVYASIDTFHTDRRFKPWLFTIATNKARDMLRRQARRGVMLSDPVDINHDTEGLSIVDLMPADHAGPDQTVSDQELRQRVRDVVQGLPDHLREILLLAYFHQFPYKEIADMLSIPLGTVKSRLHAAVAAFAQAWALADEPNRT